MERAKLKLAVIVLLALLNLCLLAVVLIRHGQAELYEQTGRDQAIIYLERRGLTVREDSIPWDSALLDPGTDPTALLLPPLPAEGMADAWETQPMAQPETLLVDLAVGLDSLGARCSQILTITEGYTCTSQEDRSVLTPVWVVETDAGVFRLDCAAGELARADAISSPGLKE